MDIAISSAVFYPEQTEEALKRAIELGFRKFEIFFNCDYEISGEYVKKLSEILSPVGAEVISVHPYTSLFEGVFFFSEYGRRTEEGLDKYKRFFEGAKALGARFFTFHGDRNIQGIKPFEDGLLPTDGQVKSISRLCDAARDAGVELCLENVSWCKSSNFGYLKRMKEALGDKFKFTLDLKQAHRAGVSPYEYMDVFGDGIRNVHVSDSDELHDCLLPGEGQFDFPQLFKKLSDLSYRGDAVIEIYSTNFDTERQIVQSKKFLEEIIRQNA